MKKVVKKSLKKTESKKTFVLALKAHGDLPNLWIETKDLGKFVSSNTVKNIKIK